MSAFGPDFDDRGWILTPLGGAEPADVVRMQCPETRPLIVTRGRVLGRNFSLLVASRLRLFAVGPEFVGVGLSRGWVQAADLGKQVFERDLSSNV